MLIFLPRLNRVRISGFGLYTPHEDIVVEFNKAATCLAGANGIGKSTLLSGIIYALSGVVPHPDKSFEQIPKYIESSSRFSHEYFAGRIREEDRQRAEISVSFYLAETEIEITRGFFEADAIRSLRVNQEIKSAGSREERKELSREYEGAILSAAGLATFEQFVFLLLFVLTFDERRTLLFWNEILLSLTLHIFFGVDPENAERVRRLYDEIGDADSWARNSKWQATLLRKQLEQLNMPAEGIDVGELAKIKHVHERLYAEVEELRKQVQTTRAMLPACKMRLAELTAQHQEAKRQYDVTFEEFLKGKNSIDVVKSFPLIKNIISEKKCPACGSEGADVRIQLLLKEEKCPICQGSVQVRGDDKEYTGILTELDGKMNRLSNEMDLESAKLARVGHEYEELALLLEEKEKELADMESNSKWLGEHAKTISSEIPTLLKKVSDFEEMAKQYREKREAMVSEAALLRDGLTEKYRMAEEEFLPMFRELARLFTGLDLDLQIDQRSKYRVPVLQFSLHLDLEYRQSPFQLSESQRFFIDIALRMALLRYLEIKNGDNKGGLLIDTPEGSLDIAYETNAGKMFARFVRDGGWLVLTSNINSSGLVRSMARECGLEYMKIENMTLWANLSQVQMDNYYLFERSYDEMVRSLGGIE